MLEAKGRCGFPKGVKIGSALSAPGLRLLPLAPEVAIERSRLPGQMHGDPVDRILVEATARILNATLVTQDPGLLNYGAQSYLSAIKG